MREHESLQGKTVANAQRLEMQAFWQAEHSGVQSSAHNLRMQSAQTLARAVDALMKPVKNERAISAGFLKNGFHTLAILASLQEGTMQKKYKSLSIAFALVGALQGVACSNNASSAAEVDFESLTQSQRHKACAIMSACGAVDTFRNCLSNMGVVSVQSIGAVVSGGIQLRSFAETAVNASSCEDFHAPYRVETVGDDCTNPRCDGDVLRSCTSDGQNNRVPVAFNCRAFGQTCVVKSGEPKCADALASSGLQNHCEGNVATNNDGGLLVETDCEARTCTMIGGSAYCVSPRVPCTTEGSKRCDGNVVEACVRVENELVLVRQDCAAVEGACDLNVTDGPLTYCRVPESVQSRTVGCQGTVAFFETGSNYIGQFDCATIGARCAGGGEVQNPRCEMP